MNSELLKDIKELKGKKWIIGIMTLVAIVTYGYFLTHSTIGLDDTAIERYFIGGWAPYVGRWTLFLLNKIFDFAHFTPWFMDVIGVILLCVAAYLFCVLFYRISDKKVNTLSLVAFASVFITYPLIGEVYIYYLHNGVSLSFCLLALSGLAWWEYLSKGDWKQVVWIVPFLSLAIGCYESFALVYLVMICAIYVIGIAKNAISKRKTGRWFIDIGMAIVPFLLSVIIRTIMYTLINVSLGLESNARGMSSLELWILNDPIVLLKDLVYQFLIRYILNGQYIFGIKVFVIIMIAMIITLMVVAIVKKKWYILIWGLAMLVSPWVLVIVELTITPYRASQAIMLLIAFSSFFVFEMMLCISGEKGGKCISIILGLFLAVVVFRQGFELNEYFYQDYIRSEYNENYCREIATEIIQEHDIAKPVIFVGQRTMPEGFREYAYLELDTQEYYNFSIQMDLRYTKALYNYVDPECGYRIYDIASTDMLNWLSWAELGDGKYEIYRYMEMLGYEFEQPSAELRKQLIDEAIEIQQFPIWPQNGSVVETEDYIVVYLGKVTLEL